MRLRLLYIFFSIASTMSLRRSWTTLLRTSRHAAGRWLQAPSAGARPHAKAAVSPSSKALCTAAVLLASISTTSLAASAGSGEGAEAAESGDTFKDTAMYPPLTAHTKGTLKVSDTHTIAYSLYGNPKGKPVLFVHGGPGGGTNPAMARYFDPQARPACCLTTQYQRRANTHTHYYLPLCRRTTSSWWISVGAAIPSPLPGTFGLHMT